MQQTGSRQQTRTSARSSGDAAIPPSWYLVSSHGAVLFWVAVHPECTIPDLTESLCLTRRTVFGLVGDLRRAGMLHVRKEGRRHRYSVNGQAPFRHPVMEGFPLHLILGELMARAGRSGGWRDTKQASLGGV